ncbi:hypothetical protein AGLY_015103 [Aphis glycines]|uniref:Pre-C2HC domain-containing protein n=1 Tax=Aphis glycines TaxID=307491 RepID=A0A6G0T2E0_APHGL|nr:hypothetical protein AGLY_015103 [Aphis glycines]
MSSTKIKHNTNSGNSNQQTNTKTNTSKQTTNVNENTQTHLTHGNSAVDVNTSDGFTLVKGKRVLSTSSQASSSSVTTNTPQLHNNKKTKLFKTTNRFQILSHDIDPGPDPPMSPNLDNDGHNDVFKPPPPIFVRGVTNYSDLTTTLIELIGVDNFFCKASADRLKIQTANPESYRSLIHFLKDEGAEYHTYQLKEDKPLRVVIRNLHHTTEPDTIKEELEVRMFDVRRVTNVLHRVTKTPLPLFFVDLEPQIKSNDIFQLTSLLHTKIRVEEPYKSKILSQCNNCQEYGHTKTYCGYPPRCVRCGAGHKTPDCPNQRSDPPKCALCSGNHPASYRGCSIYKDLQRVKKPFTKSNFVSTNTKTNFSYVKDSRPSNDTHLNQSNAHFPTYAQATSGRPVNNAASETTPDLNNTITRFLEEFKSLLNPLMSLLTTTHFTKYSTIHIPGYKLLKTNHPDGTAHGGVALLIKSSILFELLPNFCLDHLQSCAIIVKLNNIPITIAAIYSPPKHKITVQNYTNYFNTVGNNFIIGGDFNAKHHSWGCRATNPSGSVLHNFVSQNNFKVLAPPGPTYWPTSVRKNPDILDIFIAKIPSNIHCNTINILDLNSDHSSVILTLNASPPLRPISPKLFSHTTNKLQFHELVDQRIQLNVKLKSKDDLDSAVNNFTNIIQSSAWSSSKQTTPPSNLSPMPAHIREVIVQKRRARAYYQRSRLPSHKQLYNKLSNALKKLLAKHKSNSFASYLTNLSHKDGSLWRATKNVCKTKTPNIPIKKPDGSLAVTDSDKTEAFKQHLSDIFVPHSDIFCPHNINSVEEFLNVPLPAF